MKGTLNKYYKRPPVVAVELFSAGWCNLACKYCYIPKTDFLKGIHENIIKSIEDGTFINDIKEIYGDTVESFSHWGTEPTLTVKHFKSFYDEAVKIFPNFKEVKISSNFMTNPMNLVVWLTEILPQSKKLDVSIQVSHDGPAFITDKNRIGGSSQAIINNCLKFTEEINKVGTIHNVKMHLKPTSGEEDIELLSHFEHALEYYTFFDDFVSKWVEKNKNKEVSISTSVDPTIVLPGSYTKRDGINFNNLYKNQMKLKERDWKIISSPDSNYYHRWKEKWYFLKEFFIKQKMFTCSAGDSCFALGDIPGTSHICHQSFYMDHPTYYDEARDYGLDEQSMEGIDSGRTQQLIDTFIKHKDDELGTMRMMYLTRGYNDFVEHKMSVSIAHILELAHVGQINSIYKDVKMAEQLSYFAQVTDCPMVNTTITGSQLVSTSSLMKLFGNGVFENIFKRLLEEEVR